MERICHGWIVIPLCVNRVWYSNKTMLEECEASSRPVKVNEPHFKVFPEFDGASYQRRYELFCRKLVLDRHYTAAAFITSAGNEGLTGGFHEPADDLSLERFAKILTGHIGIVL